MELVYLWVEEYKNIKNQGFNFSPRFECKYDGENLTITENKDYMSIFPDNINITAIVGENGSGKSNLLNLLFNEHFTANVFFVLKIDTRLKVYGIDLDNSKYQNNTINKENLVDKIFKCTNLKSGKLNSCKLAFYTPLLQNTFTDNQHNHITKKYNLSPVSLFNDYKESDKIYKNITFKNLYTIYESNIIQNVIDMIKNCQTLNLPFDIPNKLTISVNKIVDNEEFLPQYEFLKEKKRNDENFYSYVEQRTIKNWFSNSFEDFYSKNNEDEKKSLLEPIKNCFKEYYSIDALIDILPQTIKIGGVNANIDFLHQELKEIKTFLDEIKNLANLETINSLKLNISDIQKDFISKYNKVIKSCSAFLHFDWMPKLSSGQQTFLSQFSLFYKYLNNNDNTFLFIDEGESTLHPNWQKMYIKYIIDFFQKNIQNKKIHIIFSSHSPFILSDIQKENVIFLKKYKENDEEVKKDIQKLGNCKNVTKHIELKTFGANIHTLLSNGFFMSDGLMGEFAKSKINEIKKFYEIVKFLEPKNKKYKRILKILYLFKIKEFEYIQSLIGEQFLQKIIKNYLDELKEILDNKNYKINKEKDFKELKKFSKEELQKYLDEMK